MATFPTLVVVSTALQWPTPFATKKRTKTSTTSANTPPTPKKLIAMKNVMKRLLNKKLKSGPRRKSKMVTVLRRKKLRTDRLVKRKRSARMEPKPTLKKNPS
jgi:hypothetical protein